MYGEVKLPNLERKWRPSNEFNEAIKKAKSTFKYCPDRAYICRAALKTYRQTNFDYTPTDKKNEKGSNKPITLKIEDSVIFTNHIMNTELTDSDIEGITIKYIKIKIGECNGV